MTDPYAETDTWPAPRLPATLPPSQRSEAPEAVPTPDGAREALVEQLAEVLDSHDFSGIVHSRERWVECDCGHRQSVGEGDINDLIEPAMNAHRARVVAAQVEAAVSVVRAERDEAKSEVERLRAACIPLTDLVQELDLARQNLHHSRAMSDAHFARAETAEARLRELGGSKGAVDLLGALGRAVDNARQDRRSDAAGADSSRSLPNPNRKDLS